MLGSGIYKLLMPGVWQQLRRKVTLVHSSKMWALGFDCQSWWQQVLSATMKSVFTDLRWVWVSPTPLPLPQPLGRGKDESHVCQEQGDPHQLTAEGGCGTGHSYRGSDYGDWRVLVFSCTFPCLLERDKSHVEGFWKCVWTYFLLKQGRSEQKGSRRLTPQLVVLTDAFIFCRPTSKEIQFEYL